MTELSQVGLLLERQLITLYQEGMGLQQSILFVEPIPISCLVWRESALERGCDTTKWILVTDVALGGEWLDELRGKYQIGVVFVDDLPAARQTLKLPMAGNNTQLWIVHLDGRSTTIVLQRLALRYSRGSGPSGLAFDLEGFNFEQLKDAQSAAVHLRIESTSAVQVPWRVYQVDTIGVELPFETSPRPRGLISFLRPKE